MCESGYGSVGGLNCTHHINYVIHPLRHCGTGHNPDQNKYEQSLVSAQDSGLDVRVL